jgi:hypothetical protein
MGRLFPSSAIAIAVVLLASLLGCSSSSPTNATAFPVPANITLSPTPDASVEVGSLQAFTATAKDNKGVAIVVPIFFHSSNTAVVTISAGGLACAGTWDSLTLPVVCTPGPVGEAEITATAKGISSPATTVHVHQHIDSIVVSPVPGQPPQTDPCFSKDATYNYQATAYSRGGGPPPGTDITQTVGPFSWQAVNPLVVQMNTTADGLTTGQTQAKAITPGISSFFASVSGVSSLPMSFTTCAVQSISLALSDSSSNSFSIASGGLKTIVPTVKDSLGTIIKDVPLSWNSSESGTISVSTSGVATGKQAGSSTIIGSCTPPTCNIGFAPTLPIYPENVINGTVTGTGTSGTAIIWVASQACQLVDGCISQLVPIFVPNNTIGTGISLPATPNSLIFSSDGTAGYLGTTLNLQGTRGLMVFNPATPALTQFVTSISGKVLAVSPDGRKVIVSRTDPTEPPNQVFIFDTATSAIVAFPINGATAADFSPDSFKAYILAGSTLYVYSTLEALQTITLGAPANDVSFLSNGAFAYLGGGAPSAVTSWTTCDNSQAPTVSTPHTPSFLQTLPNATQVLGVDPPGLDILSVNTTPVGCPPTVVNSLALTADFGQGNFTPVQLIVTPDSSKAYVFASDLGSVLVFNVAGLTTRSIQLTGNAKPVQATLTPDGTLLYVAADDGTVHALDTVVGFDMQQISFAQNPDTQLGGLCSGLTFPLQAIVNITDASQSGSDTTYTYTLTSGPVLRVGMSIVIAGMGNTGNDGTFTIKALGTGTFTVTNSSGVSANGQGGTGTVTLNCFPELIAARP